MPEANPQTAWSVWQDAGIAEKFVCDRRSGILGAQDQLMVMCQLVEARHPVPEPLAVLDLGCGDGVLLAAILAQWPQSGGVALDGSAAMLDRAHERLSQFAHRVRFVEVDFTAPRWTELLAGERFDAVVSGFAIHHSEDPIKRSIYAQVFELLAPGGVFVNIEHVSSPSVLGEQLFERAYAGSVAASRRRAGQETSVEAVYEELRARPDKAANRLTPVEAQLAWLRAIGFSDVDCYWKHYEMAVLAGYRMHGDGG